MENKSQVAQNESSSRDFKGIWIPKEIWLNRDLSWLDKALWAEITSLDCPDTGCFASNEYFSNFFGMKDRMIRRSLSKLKNLGLVIQESFNGRKRVLRSSLNTINLGRKKVLHSSLNDVGEVANTPEVQKNASQEISCRADRYKNTGLGGTKVPVSLMGEPIEPDNKVYNLHSLKENEVNREAIAPPFRPSVSSFAKKEKKPKKIFDERKEVTPEVWIKPSHEKTLLAKLSNDQKDLADCYKALSAWKIAQQISGDPKRDDDFYKINTWVIDALEKEKANPKKGSIKNGQIEKNKALATRLLKHFRNEHPDVYVGHNYVEFYLGQNNHSHIKFDDNGFEEQVENCLRKLGLWGGEKT